MGAFRFLGPRTRVGNAYRAPRQLDTRGQCTTCFARAAAAYQAGAARGWRRPSPPRKKKGGEGREPSRPRGHSGTMAVKGGATSHLLASWAHAVF